MTDLTPTQAAEDALAAMDEKFADGWCICVSASLPQTVRDALAALLAAYREQAAEVERLTSDRDGYRDAAAAYRASRDASDARADEARATLAAVEALVKNTDGDWLDGADFDGLAGCIQEAILDASADPDRGAQPEPETTALIAEAYGQSPSDEAVAAYQDAVLSLTPEPPPEPTCGFDVGDPPDSCRCLLGKGHEGLHQCKHWLTPPEPTDAEIFDQIRGVLDYYDVSDDGDPDEWYSPEDVWRLYRELRAALVAASAVRREAPHAEIQSIFYALVNIPRSASNAELWEAAQHIVAASAACREVTGGNGGE